MKRWLTGFLLLASCAPPPSPVPEVRGELGDRAPATRAHTAGTADRTAPVIPADAPLVAFLGDSITAGLHLPADQAWPAVLQRDLAARALPFRLQNAGVSGDTSAGGLARIEWITKQKPRVVVIELGGNDGLRGQDVSGIEANLRAIVAQVRAAGSEVLLLGMRLPPSLGADYTTAFAALYERIARDLDVPFVPNFMDRVGGVPEFMQEDGLHPTARGHERLAENVRAKLSELLAR